MKKTTIIEFICEALGEASVLFMSQKCKGTEIIMPTVELEEIAIKTTKGIVKLINYRNN